jgi:L,D-transpeptidase catalytic domain
MKNYIIASLIVALVISNIYFFIAGKKVESKPVILGNSIPLSTESVAATTNSFTYSVPAYEMNTEIRRVRNTQLQLKQYAAKNKCNQDYAFVIDMRIPSYKKRFFVYNLKRDSIIASGLVAHGIGSETFRGELIFSNTPDSRCSSLGKYKIGSSYSGLWGFSYRLQGLDSTNNKALMRAVVLHSLDCVPDIEPNESPICFSYGCPMVSPAFLQKLKGYISKQGKTPILMEMIY